MKKRWIVLVVCMMLVMAVSLLATAFVPPLTEKQIRSLTEVADSWLDANYNDGTELDEILPIANDKEVIGYSLSFIKDGLPNGYLIINTELENADVVEFSFSGISLYDRLLEDVEDAGLRVSEYGQKYLYCSEALNYGIEAENETGDSVIFDNNQKLNEDIDAVQEVLDGTPADDDFYAGIRTGWPSGSHGMTTYSLPIGNFVPYRQSQFAKGYNEGNCSPANTMNMLMYWKSRGYSKIGTAQQVYDKIVEYSGYDWTTGGLSRPKAISAANKYVKSLGYKVSDFDYWWDPMSYFINDINDGYTVATSIRSSTDGHLVIALGYAGVYYSGEWRSITHLKVIDGWYASTDRYLQFDGYYNSVQGTKWKLK